MSDQIEYEIDAEEEEEIGIKLCRCHGEGCRECDNTGVIYP